MNRTIFGTLILTLAAVAAGCAKTSCDELADSSSASAADDDANPGASADDDFDPCGLSCSSDADCVTPGPYCVKGQCREHPGPQGSS